MNKIDRDTDYHCWDMVYRGDNRDTKSIEIDASWKALHDQIPKEPKQKGERIFRGKDGKLKEYSPSEAWVKGNNFEETNESKNMNKKLIRLTESDLHRIVKESVCKILKEADRHRPGYFKDKPDRHREGYWKERWAKQKAAKQTESEKDADTSEKSQKQASKPQKDRHRKGYYHDYNQAHPERLNRGFTKGYKNGNVSDDLDIKKDERIWLDPDTYIIGYDEIGRPITNHPLSDLLRNKEMEWHDYDWDEGSWDD